jgi:4-diphosphocytidyl-2-C-methyl-D-erythritol kinase
MTTAVHYRAPAKVNFRLDVLRRRPDGYHDLRMLMQRVDLCDELVITVRDEPGVVVRCGRAGVPDGPDNLAWRAADALLKLSGRQEGLEIAITKQIPVAAGLGGGSSDCATTLMAVNELLELGLERRELMRIGLGLGADVPFFVFQEPALAEGVGDRLTRLEGLPPLWLVLVNPGVHVSTAWVFRNLQLTTEKVAAKIPFLYGTAADVSQVLSNDLEAVTIGRFPVIGQIKEQLLRLGASGALMSGSGPTVFAVFAEEDAARQAADRLVVKPGWFVKAVRTI